MFILVTGTYNPLDIEFVSITVVPSRAYVSFSHVMYPWNVTSIVLLYIIVAVPNKHSFIQPRHSDSGCVNKNEIVQ